MRFKADRYSFFFFLYQTLGMEESSAIRIEIIHVTSDNGPHLSRTCPIFYRPIDFIENYVSIELIGRP